MKDDKVIREAYPGAARLCENRHPTAGNPHHRSPSAHIGAKVPADSPCWRADPFSYLRVHDLRLGKRQCLQQLVELLPAQARVAGHECR